MKYDNSCIETEVVKTLLEKGRAMVREELAKKKAEAGAGAEEKEAEEIFEATEGRR